MTIQWICAALLVGYAVWCAIRWALRRRRHGDSCNCHSACTGCSLADHCSKKEPENEKI